MVNCHKLSERHACALVGLSRDSYRHEIQASGLNVELRQKIVQIAYERRRWAPRIYNGEGLSIRKRKKAKRIGARVPLVAALAVNQTWEAWTL